MPPPNGGWSGPVIKQLTFPERPATTRETMRKKEKGRLATAEETVAKPLSKTQVLGRVLELQHAAMLVLARHVDLDVETLNNEVRSLLDQYWDDK